MVLLCCSNIEQVADGILHGWQANIVCPNKHTAQSEAMYKGHLLESETYIGGKVEALESGVFRSDLPMRFKCKPEAYQVQRPLLLSHMMHFIVDLSQVVVVRFKPAPMSLAPAILLAS